MGAVRGPAYADSGLFRRGAHFNEDGAMPLLAAFEALQQENCKMYTSNLASTSARAEPTSHHHRRQMLPADEEPDRSSAWQSWA